MRNTRLALAVIAALATSLFTRAAFATLEENEKKSLKKVVKVYKQAMGIEKLYKILGPDLGKGRRKFLAEKIKGIENERLPELQLRGESKIILRVGSLQTTVEFISLRSETLAINGKEIEFGVDESLESRWERLTHAIERRDASFSLFFEQPAFAAGSKPDYSPTQIAAIRSFTAVISAMVAAARNGVDCSQFTDRVRRTCDRMLESYSMGETPVNPSRPAPVPPRDCVSTPPSKEENAAIKKKMEEILTRKNQLSTAEQKQDFADETLSPTQLKTVNAEDPAKGDAKKSMTAKLVRYKAGELADQTVEAINKFKDDKICVSEITSCSKQLFGAIAKETDDQDLACFVTQQRRRVEAAEAGTATPARPGGPVKK